MTTFSLIDSHTGGEPTRLLVDGGPDLGSGPLAERRARMREQFDHLRRAMVCEPRASSVVVGGVLCAPHAPDCVAGVIFFNSAGYLGMCGHGMMGVIASLAWMGRIGPGTHRVDTPVGVVEAVLHDDGSVTVHNVPSYRHAHNVAVSLDGDGVVLGDVAWGGNWFFLVSNHGLTLEAANIGALTAFTTALMHALAAQSITGANGAPIDHIELFAPSSTGADSQSFVLCPGGAYDRSPCGTGTSAKLACLAADGVLAEGALWRQESIIGSVFDASYRRDGDCVLPSLRGRAWVNAKIEMIVSADDPFGWGMGG